MRFVTAALTTLGAAVLTSGCGVPEGVPGYYSHPDAGVIDLDDERYGTYLRHPGDIRAVRGEYVPATIEDVRSYAPEEVPPPPDGPSDGRLRAQGAADEPSWDRLGLEFRVKGDIVTLLPSGGDPVDLTMVDGDLVLMQPGGLELVFQR